MGNQLEERTKPVTFTAWIGRHGEDIKNWITGFQGLTDYRGGGFEKSSGTYTVPEDGIYIFGLKAKSGSQLASSRIDFYRNNAYVQAVVYEGNEKDYWNNLGTWTDSLNK